MKQKDVLTKNNDLLNVMFRGTYLSCLLFSQVVKNVFKKIKCFIYPSNKE